jgi:hypothetical protein
MEVPLYMSNIMAIERPPCRPIIMTIEGPTYLTVIMARERPPWLPIIMAI